MDRSTSSLVKYFEGGRHGTTYPDMTWEPKEGFRAMASYYATSKTIKDKNFLTYTNQD